MYTSRKERLVDEAALVPSASKREKLSTQSASSSYSTKSTHQTTLVPYITAEAAINEAAVAPDASSRKPDMSVSERALVPQVTAIPIELPAESNTRNRKRMCSCCRNKRCRRITIITVVILVAFLLFLKFYLFKARKPKITSQEVKVKNLTFSIDPLAITLSLKINIALKNPNYAGWKYKPSNTTLYYHGPEVGLATVPAGVVGSRSRAAVNITVDVNTTAMTSSKYLKNDLKSGYLPLDTYTVMTGKVLLIKIIKIHATVYSNCSVNITLSTWDTATSCKVKVHL